MGKILLLCLLGAITASSAAGIGEFSENQVDVETLHVADFAVSKINENVSAEEASNGIDFELAGILSSEKQVVSGLRYALKLVADAGDEKHVFTAEVYLPLQDEPELLKYGAVTPDVDVSSEFKDIRSFQEFDNEDKEILSAAATAVRQMSLRLNSMGPLELAGVHSAVCKVVSGEGTTCELSLSLKDGAKDTQEYEVTLNRSLTTKWKLLAAKETPMLTKETSEPSS